MLQAKSVHLLALTVLSVFVSIRCMHLQNEMQHAKPLEFSCKGGRRVPLPQPPDAFSYNVRLNIPIETRTVEYRHSKDKVGKRESLEIFAPGRHVKYIVYDKKHLLVTFPDDDYPTCTVTSSSTIKLEKVDSGSNGILQNILDLSQKPDEFSLIDAEENKNIGVFVKIWEGCFKKPSINISFSYSDNWKNPGAGIQNQILPVKMEVATVNNYLIGLVDKAQTSMPPDVYFQPPEDVYCPGFREDVKPPEVPNYFSYDAETVMFSSRDEVAPFVLHRSVYYDYNSNLSRIDFQDIELDNPDATVTKFRATGNFVIHDYISKLVYLTTSPDYRCELLDYEVTEGVVEEKNTNESPMMTGKEYFGLDAKKISYNGQFMTRGYLADVFTASIKHLDGTNGSSVYSWYFSAVGTQVVEQEKAEKNVLLRVVFHPESGDKRRDRVEQNLYNFVKKQPSPQKFDITGCYDETLSKLYVITFPANNALRGSENLLKVQIHSSLMEATGLKTQRIYVTQVAFNKEFMFAEFKLLDSPAALKTKPTKIKEPSIAEAADQLKNAVADGSFKVSASVEEVIVTVIPLADGFNEFGGDRKKIPDSNSYATGSVVGLTIGMLLLGFVLGGVVLNLVISRKFGVSLFQTKKGGQGKFNTLNESGL